MAFGKDSKGIRKLRALNGTDNSQIKEEDTVKKQKLAKKKFLKAIEQIVKNGDNNIKVMQKAAKHFAKDVKSYSTTATKLHTEVSIAMTSNIKRGKTNDKLSNAKTKLEMCNEVFQSCDTIAKNLEKKEEEIAKKIEQCNSNIAKEAEKITLKTDMDYATSVVLAYKQGRQLIDLKILEEIESNTKHKDLDKIINSTKQTSDEQDAGEVEKEAKKLQILNTKLLNAGAKLNQTAGESEATKFLKENIKKISDPVLKLGFISGMLHALCIKLTSIIKNIRSEIKEAFDELKKVRRAISRKRRILRISIALLGAIAGLIAGFCGFFSGAWEIIAAAGWLISAIMYGIADLKATSAERREDAKTVRDTANNLGSNWGTIVEATK